MLDCVVERTNQYIDRMPKTVTVTSSQSNNDFDNFTSLIVPYSLVVLRKDCCVYLVTDEEKISVLGRLHRFDKTLPDIGLKRKG